MATRPHADAEHSGWIRSDWLAEKVASGELPAATSELTKQCDAFFVGQDRLEDHARVLAQCLAVAGDGGRADGGRRSEDLLVYLRRLLAVREMWARERS
jgi:hypothetical protein